ncbi:MAG TPA: nuclear transport factor 2 family protein [Actinomycetota bacterium]|nr:nuclear transport factor 2 family protein [Actinomycetota bacterium]
MERFSKWVEGYRRAWETNDPEDIRSLFTEGAVYHTEPYAEPIVGREAIVEDWIERKDEPGDTQWSSRVIGVDGDLGFVQGEAIYTTDPPRTYSNLWVIRLEGDRCREFTEWWMKHDP